MPTFRPFTRESLAKIEARLEAVHEKKKEVERRRAEGEVCVNIKVTCDQIKCMIYLLLKGRFPFYVLLIKKLNNSIFL